LEKTRWTRPRRRPSQRPHGISKSLLEPTKPTSHQSGSVVRWSVSANASTGRLIFCHEGPLRKPTAWSGFWDGSAARSCALARLSACLAYYREEGTLVRALVCLRSSSSRSLSLRLGRLAHVLTSGELRERSSGATYFKRRTGAKRFGGTPTTYRGICSDIAFLSDSLSQLRQMERFVPEVFLEALGLFIPKGFLLYARATETNCRKIEGFYRRQMV